MTTVDPYENAWPYYPVRPVDWRVQRAEELLSQRNRKPSPDPIIRALVAQFQYEAGFPPGRPLNPEVQAARQLRLFEDDRCAELEARILARQTIEQIAETMRLSESVVRTYTDCYFDVCERLDATCYIRKCAIFSGGSLSAPSRHNYAFWRALGYYGGPVLLEASLPLWQSIPSSTLGPPCEQSPIVPRTESARLHIRLRAVYRQWCYAMAGYFGPVPTESPVFPPKPILPWGFELQPVFPHSTDSGADAISPATELELGASPALPLKELLECVANAVESPKVSGTHSDRQTTSEQFTEPLQLLEELIQMMEIG